MIILCCNKLLRNNCFFVSRTMRFIPEFVRFFNGAFLVLKGKFAYHHLHRKAS